MSGLISKEDNDNLKKVQKIMREQKLSLEDRKILYYMFFPNHYDKTLENYTELGNKIKKLIDNNDLIIKGFDTDFNLKYEDVRNKIEKHLDTTQECKMIRLQEFMR